MPSPITFSKNVVIWVDDIPANNEKTVREFNKGNFEMLQLTSTKMAETWIK